jgi:hypothetical protein
MYLVGSGRNQNNSREGVMTKEIYWSTNHKYEYFSGKEIRIFVRDDVLNTVYRKDTPTHYWSQKLQNWIYCGDCYRYYK